MGEEIGEEIGDEYVLLLPEFGDLDRLVWREENVSTARREEANLPPPAASSSSSSLPCPSSGVSGREVDPLPAPPPDCVGEEARPILWIEGVENVLPPPEVAEVLGWRGVDGGM